MRTKLVLNLTSQDTPHNHQQSGPEEWPDLFGEPLLAAAGLDRLTHQAQSVVITGTSFRTNGPEKEMAIEPTPS